MNNNVYDWIASAILLTGALASFGLKKLTGTAAITGALVGWLIYKGTGPSGILLMALFFILGTAATSFRKKEKRNITGNAVFQSTRTSSQVLANAGTAALVSILALLFPIQRALFQLMMAGSFAAAAGDTFSSELGMLYGRRFFNILTGRPDEKGQDGVISIEGLLIGIAGSALIAVTWLAMAHPHRWLSSLLIITAAGTFGNLIDSVLGAACERKGCLSNDLVNFGNTLAAALLTALLTQIS